MGHITTNRRSATRATLGICALALFLLAFASPAQAADEHIFDPVLSLEGDCKAEDGVADPSCTGEPLAYPAGNAPKAFSLPCGTATDLHGSIYVANSGGTNLNGEFGKGEIAVFDPQGKFLTKIPTEHGSCQLAVDSKGAIYGIEADLQEVEGNRVAFLDRYEPDSYPPTAATKYTLGARFEFIELEPGGFADPCAKPRSVAVDPSNDHLYIGNVCRIEEYGSAAEGTPLNPLLDCCIGEGSLGGNPHADVYGGNHDVYVTQRIPFPSPTVSKIVIFDGADGHLKCELNGSDTPAGEFKLGQKAALAVDQSNGDFYVYDQGRAKVMHFGGGGEGCPHFIGELPPASQAFVIVNTVDPDFAVDAPCRTGYGSGGSCNTGTYESPNAGHFFATSGSNANNSHLFAFEAPSETADEHPLTVAKTGSGFGTVTSSPSGVDCGSECSAFYEEGAKVTLTATPEGGSTFAGWSGSGCSDTGTCEVTISAAKAVTAEFTAGAKPEFALKVKKAGSGTGTVTSSPAGINCGLTCEAEYEEGTAVTLTGAAGANTKPVTWGGCDSVDGENKCLVTMGAAREVTATFALEQHLLSVSTTGSGTGKVTSSPPGIDCGATCSASFDHGTVITLNATPDAGSEFSGWSGACTGAGTCEVTMSAAKAVTANFDEEEAPPGGIALTVDVEGTGSGTVTSDKGAISCSPFCSDEYAEGTVVVLTATPAPGSVFYSWKYCDKGGVNGRQCTMTVDKAKTVKATFTTTHALEVSKAPGSGLGKVQSSPGGILCLFNCSETSASFKEGTEVTVKQTPAKHFHFVEWLGDCTGSDACELTMGEDHEVQAKFTEVAKHLLTVNKSGGGQGTAKSNLAGINCGATCSSMASAYYQDVEVELTAIPGKGSAFGQWSAGSGCGVATTCVVKMSEAKEISAFFK